MTASIGSDAALGAFETAADVYDAFTAHHDYEAWVTDILELARPYGPVGPRLLDLGCGTGKSFVPFLRRGFDVVACDQSPAMLRHAKHRAGTRARIVTADLRALPVLGSFHWVQALDDVFNYLTPDELAPAFAGVARNLAPDGLFVFDVNTVHMLRSFFGATEVHESGHDLLVWRGEAPADLAPGGIADATLDAFVADPEPGRWRRIRSRHREHHHPVESLAAALERAGMCLLGAFGQDLASNFEHGVDELRHTKSMVIARPEGAPARGGG
jgi:SAM-dependent methyltransferase